MRHVGGGGRPSGARNRRPPVVVSDRVLTAPRAALGRGAAAGGAAGASAACAGVAIREQGGCARARGGPCDGGAAAPGCGRSRPPGRAGLPDRRGVARGLILWTWGAAACRQGLGRGLSFGLVKRVLVWEEVEASRVYRKHRQGSWSSTQRGDVQSQV